MSNEAYAVFLSVVAFEAQRDHGFDSYPVLGFLITTMTRLLILSYEFNQLLKTGFEPRNN